MSQQSLPNRSARNTNAPDGDFPHGVAYLDGLRVWFPRLSKHERARLERHGRDKLTIKKCRASIPSDWWLGWVVIVPRPTQSILRDLDALQFRQAKSHGRISRLDVACDWPFLTQTAADAAKHYLHDHLLLPHRRKGPMQTFGSGAVAWLKYKIGQRCSKNLLCYADKPSKIIKSSCCCHLEIRFYNARACRAAGLYRVGDLIELDPAQLFDRSIRLTSHKDAKGPIQRFHDRYPRKTLIKIPLAVLNIPHVLLSEHVKRTYCTSHSTYFTSHSYAQWCLCPSFSETSAYFSFRSLSKIHASISQSSLKVQKFNKFGDNLQEATAPFPLKTGHLILVTCKSENPRKLAL